MEELTLKILVVEDEKLLRMTFCRVLDGHSVFETASPQEARNLITEHRFDVAFLDLKLSEGDTAFTGKSLITYLVDESPTTSIVVMTGQEEEGLIDECMDLGADDYIFKPIQWPHLSKIVAKARKLSDLKRTKADIPANTVPLEEKLKTKSPKLKKVLNDLKKLRGKSLSVLITGETGVGKELLARYLWQLEENPSRPFVDVDCGALNSNLIESALFGHRKGSFTGAIQNQVGKLELADNGDIFLDEIGNLPSNLQIKLLRALNDKSITPIGSSSSKHLNFRTICATNEDLETLVAEGAFRSDLLYRIRDFHVEIPPLRERLEDLPNIVRILLDESGAFEKDLSKEAYEFCKTYSWPGNIRELSKVLRVSAELSETNLISPGEIKGQLIASPQVVRTENELMNLPISSGEFQSRVQSYEQYLVKSAFRGRKSVAAVAKHLGITRNTLASKLKNWGWSSPKNLDR